MHVNTDGTRKPRVRKKRYRAARRTASNSPISLTIADGRATLRHGATVVQSANVPDTPDKLIARPVDTLPLRLEKDGIAFCFALSAEEGRKWRKTSGMTFLQRLGQQHWFFVPGLTQEVFAHLLSLPQLLTYRVFNGNRTPLFGQGSAEPRAKRKLGAMERSRAFDQWHREQEQGRRDCFLVESALSAYDRSLVDHGTPEVIPPVDDVAAFIPSRQLDHPDQAATLAAIAAAEKACVTLVGFDPCI